MWGPARLRWGSPKWESGWGGGGLLPYGGDTNVGPASWDAHGMWMALWSIHRSMEEEQLHETPTAPRDKYGSMGCLQCHGTRMAPWDMHSSMGQPQLQGTRMAPWDIHRSMGHGWLHGTCMAPWEIRRSMGHARLHRTHTALLGGDSGDRGTFPGSGSQPEQVWGCCGTPGGTPSPGQDPLPGRGPPLGEVPSPWGARATVRARAVGG